MKWEATESYFFMRLDDKTGETRTERQMDEMVDRLIEVANEYDFDLDCYGPWSSARKIY